MTIEKLRERLLGFPDNMEIVVSSDEEGNDFNPLYDITEAYTDDLEFWRTDPPEGEKVLIFWP